MLPRFSFNLAVICAGAFLLVQVNAKTTASTLKIKNKSVEASATGSTSENVLVRLAKSLAVEALSEFKESARRNPKFGFNFTLPISMPGLINATRNGTFDRADITGSLPVTIGLSALSLKAAALSSIGAIKYIVIQIIIQILWIIFLVSGSAYFICNLGFINCGTALGGGAGGLGGLGSSLTGGGIQGGGSSAYGTGSSSGGSGNPLSFLSSRSGVSDQYLERTSQPIYKAIDEGYKKYH